MRGADLVAATKSFREREIRYAFDGSIIKKCGGFDISLPETRSGATGSSPFKVGDNQRPQAGGRAIPLALSLSSRRKPGLGAEGKIKSADAVEIHR